MALGARLARAGTPPAFLHVEATHALETADGKWRIVSAQVQVRAGVGGIDSATLRDLVEEVGADCVVSQALRGNVEISTQAELE